MPRSGASLTANVMPAPASVEEFALIAVAEPGQFNGHIAIKVLDLLGFGIHADAVMLPRLESVDLRSPVAVATSLPGTVDPQ